MSYFTLSVTALFALKIVWNLTIPYALAVRAREGGISLMPFVEVALLAIRAPSVITPAR